MYDSANGHVTVTSQHSFSSFPLDQGTSAVWSEQAGGFFGDGHTYRLEGTSDQIVKRVVSDWALSQTKLGCKLLYIVDLILFYCLQFVLSPLYKSGRVAHKRHNPYVDGTDRVWSLLLSVADPDISFGGHEAPTSSAAGARIEALKAPRGGEWKGGVPLPTAGEVWGAPSAENFFNLLLKNDVFWLILMSRCASHVYTCIAYFHFHQYKPKVTTMLE